MSIPIENIYYLLCYAWNRLDEKERVAVTAEDTTELLDLLAKVLLKATHILLKRGIDRSYILETREIAGIKGKLEFSQTAKRNLFAQQKTICSFDEFSPDILVNQILVTTLRRLIRTQGLDAQLKSEIRNLLRHLAGIESLDLQPALFTQVRLKRNNKIYAFALNVCRLIYENTLLNEHAGEFQFYDFTRDERKMSRLFEEFVRNFYRLEQQTFRVRRENINWQLSAMATQDLRYLPLMQTDITLENENTKIILDAKFYRQTLTVNFGAEKISSANLYQLFSYLLNQRDNDPRSQTATGILLYPTIEQNHDLHFRYQTHAVSIKTVNLNTEWRAIRQRLLEIIGVLQPESFNR